MGASSLGFRVRWDPIMENRKDTTTANEVQTGVGLGFWMMGRFFIEPN